MECYGHNSLEVQECENTGITVQCQSKTSRDSRRQRRQAIIFRKNLILPVLFKVDNTLEVASEIMK